MPVKYILSSVWVILSIFSQLSIIQYVGLCVFSLPISLVMVERIYCLIIIIKSEVWTITHCLGLGHETMVCAVCLSIFLIPYGPRYDHNKTRPDTTVSRFRGILLIFMIKRSGWYLMHIPFYGMALFPVDKVFPVPSFTRQQNTLSAWSYIWSCQLVAICLHNFISLPNFASVSWELLKKHLRHRAIERSDIYNIHWLSQVLG